MNFIEEYKKGQSGGNKGLPFGPGLAKVTQATNGLQFGRYSIIASAPKCGKSTYVNYAYIIEPYLYALEHKIAIEWKYFSFEMTRVDQEFTFAAFFVFHDFNITTIKLPEGILKNGKSEIDICPQYLRGRLMDDKDNLIPVNEKVYTALKEVYNKRLIPLFGEFDKYGTMIKKGLIEVIETPNNPTGIYNQLLAYADTEGEFITKTYGEKDRIVGYKSHNPEKYVIVVLDHRQTCGLS